MSQAIIAEVLKLVSTVKNSCKAAADGDMEEEARAIDALRALKSQPVTADVLKVTDAGKSVNRLSKNANSAIAKAATAVVQAWKDTIRQNISKAGKPDSQANGSAGVAAPTGAAAPSTNNPTSAPATTTNAPRMLDRDPTRTGDDTRDKIRMMFAQALLLPAHDAVGDPCTMAEDIEQALYTARGGVGPDYKSKFRQLNSNLADKANPDLRFKVLTGLIPPERLVEMGSEDLASDARRAENARIRESKKNEAVRGGTTQASTDAFQCGKCKQWKCTYYQLQTRSADEPMTTFVTCTVCNNRWKFC